MATIRGSAGSTTSTTATRAIRVGGVALVVSAVANLVASAIGRLAGADMSVVAAGSTEPTEIGVGSVLVMTASPLVLGTIALAVAGRWGNRGWNALAWAGLAIGVLTVFMPFTVQASTATALTLASLHVITGVVWFATIRRTLAS